MRRIVFLVLASAVALSVSACSFTAGSSYVSYLDEPATVSSIELLWPNGQGMGSFVDSTPGTPGALAPEHLLYRVNLVFDDGQHTAITQDGATPLEVGTRVRIEGGRVVPHPSEDANSNIERARF